MIRITILVIMALSTALPVHGGEAPPLTRSYEAEEVSNNIFVIHGPNELPNAENQGFMNNPGFIITGKGVVVVDPGSSVQTGRMVLDQVALITDKPVIASFATHIHGDHWLGNQAIVERFPDAQLFGHPDLIEKAHQGEAENWMELMLQLTAQATAGTEAFIPNLAVSHGDSLQFADTTISVHHYGKAHTGSDIALVVSPGDVMFTGDLVFSNRLGRMDDGTFIGLVAALEKLLALEPRAVVPGHGQTGDIGILKDCLALYRGIYQVVEEKFEEGLADYEIKPYVVQQLSQFSGWWGFDDAIGRLTSLAYLEVEENNF